MFEEFWKLHPVGKKEDVLAYYQGAIYNHQLTEEFLVGKMKEYMTYCKVRKTDAMYIKFPINWLKEEKYFEDFKATSGSTLSYIEKWLEGYL